MSFNGVSVFSERFTDPDSNVNGQPYTRFIAIAYATLTKVEFVYAVYFKLAPYLDGPGGADLHSP